MTKEENTAEQLADQIMRWDWRDMFREGHKLAIEKMFIEYGIQWQQSEEAKTIEKRNENNQLLQESNSIIKRLQEENQELQQKVYELEADYMELQTKLQTTNFKIKRVT